MTRIPVSQTGRWRDSTLVADTRREFPMATFRLVFRGGGTGDPPGKEGLTAFTARMLERGTAKRSRERLAEDLESLGASHASHAGLDTLSVAATTLSRNLDDVLAIVAETVLEPAFREEEVEKLRAEMLGELAVAREEDRDLGDAFFRRAVYGSKPYGHFVAGTEGSLSSITREDVAARWKEIAGTAGLIAAAAGDVDLDGLGRALEQRFGGLAAGRAPAAADPSARALEGIEVLLVDKPDRSQTQIFLGRTAVPVLHPDFLPFSVANHAFGGMFTARLMQEVRVKRGWSYGASARLEMNRGDSLTGLWTFPANADTIPCIRLLLDLYRELKESGIRDEELLAAKGHLRNMLAFEVETPEQRVGRRVSELLLGLPDDWTERWVAGVENTTVDAANAAAARVVRTDALVLTVVCTAEPFVKELEGISGVRRIEVVPFDAPDPDARRLVAGQ